jgi:predicted GNAT family N-acyltransferase
MPRTHSCLGCAIMARVRLVELSRDEGFWEELIAGEHAPFGDIGTELSWREKTLNLGLRADDGQLLAAAGLVIAGVRAGEPEPFEVTGLGGVIVTRAERGRGYGRIVIERALERALEWPPERAMLFCVPRNVALYRKFGFREIGAPVEVMQGGEQVVMPMCAMYKPLRGDPRWPAGPVHVLGEPF